ncbi:MAG TPA: slipin family protein [Pirellulaceae bacterium]|nr:slipin family protein [Pirellulaceae bacterium]HMO92387.1 slipin family protein [Pirellulaceae bacterium]HMP69507.1 slipin family protein [Pirellulaceae bacterium]
MFFVKRFKIRSHEMGLLFHDGEFRRLLGAGVHWLFDPLCKYQVDVVSQRTVQFAHDQLDVIVRSGALKGHAEVLDLKDHERAIMWIDGRLDKILNSGLYAFWLGQKPVRFEVYDIRQTRFEHVDLPLIARHPSAQQTLDVCKIERERVGVLYIEGRYVDTLASGVYAFWRGGVEANVVEVDLRESMLDVVGQDIMTSDKVTLRLNALVSVKITNAQQAVAQTQDVRQALYRETQLVLRGLIGARELDDFLTDKDGVAREIEDNIRKRAQELGLEIVSVGIRDVILPGDMKDLMNKVTEAKKAAEANLISRREETAAMRSQANTARLLAENPVLMRLRELEVLEKIAAAGKLNVILGGKSPDDKGLAEKIVNLL